MRCSARIRSCCRSRTAWDRSRRPPPRSARKGSWSALRRIRRLDRGARTCPPPRAGARAPRRARRTATPRLERIAETWRAAGFTVATFDDIDRLVWEKLICNAAFSGPCAVLDATIGEVLENEHVVGVSACAVEAYDVAVAGEIALGFDDPVAYVASFGKAIAGAGALPRSTSVRVVRARSTQ